MAKQNKGLLPSVMEMESTAVVESVSISVLERESSRTVSFRAPLGAAPGYLSRRVDVVRLTALQSETLHRIVSGLIVNGEKLLDGTPVKSAMHAIKWMLERGSLSDNPTE